MKNAVKEIKIETRNAAVSKALPTIKSIVKTSATKQDAFNRIADILPSEIKVGYGGSHIWAANSQNERVLIITGY